MLGSVLHFLPEEVPVMLDKCVHNAMVSASLEQSWLEKPPLGISTLFHESMLLLHVLQHRTDRHFPLAASVWAAHHPVGAAALFVRHQDFLRPHKPAIELAGCLEQPTL